MTLLPDLKDELLGAAARRARVGPRSRGPRSPRALLVTAALTLGVAATAGATLVATGVVGGKPTAPYRRVAGEERVGMRRTHAPLVFGVADLPTTGRVEVVGYTMRGFRGRGELLCVDLALPDGSRGGGCNRGLPARAGGLQGTGSTRDANAPRLASGATRAGGVARIAVRYRVRGRPATASAILIRVPPDLAARLGTRRFLFYVAEIPSAARAVSAAARDARGRTVWRARFPG